MINPNKVKSIQTFDGNEIYPFYVANSKSGIYHLSYVRHLPEKNDQKLFENIKLVKNSGFKLREPGCSACLAMNDDKIPAGKYAVSTTNRNFEGRQGPGARTILASPLVAAASAITGKITDPREII